MDIVAGLSPQLVWGLFPRLVGALYLMAFASFSVQIEGLGGSRGLLKTADLLAAIRRDYPGWRRFFEYPTLLWIDCSDRTLRWLPRVGALCALSAIYGGSIGYVGLVCCWLLWLSLEPLGLIFPWDTMLQELGFLVLFVPSVQPLPSLAPDALPLPTVAFMARWLPIRLMLGFGKEKFVGATRGDSLYLRGFFVWLPMPNKLSWFGHHAPAWFLRASLAFMFFAEVVAPLLGLFSGLPRLISFVSLFGLSIGIMATGNWGYFNVGYIILCLPLLDLHSSLFDLTIHGLSQWPELAIHVSMLLLFLLTLFYLPNNSWTGRSWVNWPKDFWVWPTEQQRKLWLGFHRWSEPLRWIAPFRIVNGYGVFPPNASAPIRNTPVLEGSLDGITWEQYGYKYLPSFATSAPAQVAPHHPRLDQGIYYVAGGLHSAGLTGNVMPQGSPYLAHARAGVYDLLVQRVIAGDSAVLKLLGHNPFPDRPPRYARMALVAMTPTRPQEMRRTGRWWHVRRLGELTLPRAAASWPDQLVFPHPETFNPDFVALKRRAAPLRAMLSAHAAGVELDRAVLAASELEPADVERFWGEFLPAASSQAGDWSQIHTLAQRLIEQFDIPGLYRMERILERYAWLLHERVAGDREAAAAREALSVTHFRYHLILHTVVLAGKPALQQLLAAPARLSEYAARSSDATQLWLLTLLRYEPVMSHVGVYRWSDIGSLSHRLGLPGLSEYFPFLSGQASPTELFRPQPIKHEDGEFTIEGFYPPPAAI
jgi:lipase maturation factor 1